jgi:tetratricopeptide (TPR) repeat protein
MRDLRLEEALRKVTAGQRRVKVILVGSRLPEVDRGDQPPLPIVSIPVERLSAAHFRRYLEGVATARGVDLGSIDWGLLYEALDGLPRLGQLFCSAIALDGGHLNARELARQLAKKNPVDRERALATEVVRALDDRQRRVAVALATFRTPVPARMLQDLLRDELPQSIQPQLTELADAQVVGAVDDLYYVLNGEVLATLDALPDGPATLLDKAVEVVARRSGAVERAVSARDLDMSFAEIDLRCRAGEWLTAFGRIERLDPVLRTMHMEDLLLKPREKVQKHLERAAAKVRNRNAVGTIYLVRGNVEKAQSAFTDSLREMVGYGLPVLYERRIRLNLADLFWRKGEFDAAEKAFQRVLDLIPAVGELDTEDRLDHIAALAGLADCERHWGAHDAAIRRNSEAWAEAAAEPSRQDVRIALRLARWYSEAGDSERAAGFLAEAEAVADRIAPGDLALRAQCLDGRADLALSHSA